MQCPQHNVTYSVTCSREAPTSASTSSGVGKSCKPSISYIHPQISHGSRIFPSTCLRTFSVRGAVYPCYSVDTGSSLLRVVPDCLLRFPCINILRAKLTVTVNFLSNVGASSTPSEALCFLTLTWVDTCKSRLPFLDPVVDPIVARFIPVQYISRPRLLSLDFGLAPRLHSTTSSNTLYTPPCVSWQPQHRNIQ